MDNETTLGKMVNMETRKELPFSLNPIGFTLNRQFEYQTEQRVGQPIPLISFRCGGLTQLSFDLTFDKDADKDCDIKKVDSFLSDLNTVNDKTKSISPIEFSMGAFSFRGFVSSFCFQALRFDDRGDATSVKLSMQLVSTGEYEVAE